MLKCRCLCTRNLSLRRNFSTNHCEWKSHYDSLGVTPKATQSDIKAAYYKLSMVYHPDKNKGSENASKKFQDISTAYEVLGNFKLRKLYDKGILHTAGSQFADHTPGHSNLHRTRTNEEEQDDFNNPHAKFYRSRQYASRPPGESGRKPIYNFDEWTRAHYTETIEKNFNARQRYNMKLYERLRDSNDSKIETTIIILMALVVGTFLVTFKLESSRDSDTTRK